MTENSAKSVAALPAYVCTLDRIEDERSVGGKAWNLARMLRLGLPVPPGFVVTDSAFQYFLDDNRLRDQICDLCHGVDLSDLQSLRRASAGIQAIIKAAPVPVAVHEAVQEAHRQLGTGQPLIVRSSAVGEDSRSTSFAGQLDSYRDVCSTDEIELALVRCWASCWSERALYYQLSRGVRIERMGVVVQEQVQPKAAGVQFTVSPDPSIRASEMVGEYCLGHGEDLVSGRINPGRFTVSREGFHCRFLAEPTQPGIGPGLHCWLDKTRIQTLQQIGILLEREFQGAQDIEWAIDQVGRVIFGMVAQDAAYAKGEPWLEECLTYLRGNLKFFEDYVKKNLPMLKFYPLEGTYLAWVDCSALGMDDKILHTWMLEKAKLWLDEGPMFGSGGSMFMRINIACPRSVLKQALERLEKAVNDLSA